MVARLMMWTAVLLIALGFQAREGHLLFFFGTYLLALAVGLFCRSREAGRRRRPGVESPPSAGGAAGQSG